MPSFQFNSQTIGLTFPTSKLTTEIINDWIKTNFSDHLVKHSIVARETHKSGEYHFHVAIRLGRPFRCRDQRFGDILGEHPNIVRPRSYAAWCQYVKKDGDYTEEGTIRENASAKSTPVDEELVDRQVKQLSKYKFLVWASSVKLQYAERIWDLGNAIAGTTLEEGDGIGGIIDPCLSSLKFSLDWLGSRALILIGDSGVGKTTWAKTNIPKPCLFVTHIDELKFFRANFHKSILFDDVSFKHYPIQAQIHLVDFYDPRSIHIRYGTASIPAGIIKFFTCNEDPLNIDHPAVARRIKIVRITKPTIFNHI